jgi:ERF superfamily protein
MDNLQLATTPELSAGQMLQQVLKGGITPDTIGVVERMTALYERMQDKKAEQQFTQAFVALQQDLPVIVAKSVIPNRGKYERFEDIMFAISPVLAKHGFTVSFSMDSKDGRVSETCHLSHIAGVTRSNSFAVRVGRADSETQADCKAATTAKRLALCNALNIVIRQDAAQDENDATLEGGVIAPDKAQYLREQVEEVGFKEETFFRLAGCDTYDEITEGKYTVLINAIEMRRAKK